MKNLDACIYVLTDAKQDNFHYFQFEYKGLRISNVIKEIISNIETSNIISGDKILYILVENFKGVHSFIYYDQLDNSTITEFNWDDIIEESGNPLFIHECFKCHLQLEKISFVNKDKFFDNLLN